MSDFKLQARNIYKSYPQGSSELEVLNDVSLEIHKGDAICILGPSGAGKSTLLHILGTLDQQTRGFLYYNNENLQKKTDEEISKFRNQKMGFVFQFHHLLAEFTALENVMIPSRIAGETKSHAKEKALTLLDQMGIVQRSHHFPSELSGGEQQRVAIARALMCKPEILFADEPTGNLDSKNSGMIQDVFFKLKEEYDLTLVAVTHDAQFAKRFPKKHILRDGKWQGEGKSFTSNPTDFI